MTFPITTDLLSIATASTPPTTHLSPSNTIIPYIGFVVKTIDETGRKVFINICSSDAIPLPPLWPQNNDNADQLPHEISSYLKPTKPPPPSSSNTTPTNTLSTSKTLSPTPHLKQLLAVPFQLAPHPRLEPDKSGQHHCTVTECVFHTIILHHAANYRPFKLFIIQMALGAVERQVGVQLNMTEFKLPKMRYKGTAPPPMNVFSVIRGKEKDVLLMDGKGSRSRDDDDDDGDDGDDEDEPRIVMQKKKTGRSKDQIVPSSSSGSGSKALVEVIAGAPSSSISTTFKKPRVEYIKRPVEEVKLHIEIPDKHDNGVVVAVCGEKVKIGALENDDDDDRSKKKEGRATLDSRVDVKVFSSKSTACPVLLPGSIEINLPFAVTTRGASCVVGIGVVVVRLKVVPLEMLLDSLPI